MRVSQNAPSLRGVTLPAVVPPLIRVTETPSALCFNSAGLVGRLGNSPVGDHDKQHVAARDNGDWRLPGDC